MDRITLQMLLALAMFIATAFAGLVPIKLIRFIAKKQDQDNSRRSAWILTLLSCFAGGVFMGTCFLDIFPHINSNYERFQAVSDWNVDYPIPEFFVCCGFFLVYLLEEMTLKVFSSGHHGHSHSHAHHGNGSANSTRQLTRRDLERVEAGGKGATIVHVHGRTPRSTSEGSSDSDVPHPKRNISVMTHEMVIDESVKYMSSESLEPGLLKSLTFAVAMSLHSVLEGFALGVQDDNTGIVTLFVSLMIHKGIEAFSVGLQVSKSNSKRTMMVTFTILTYAMMTPFGSLVGVLITNLNINEALKEGIVVVLESLAGGTFIYVTFFEVLAQERANDHSNLIQLNAIVTGFLVIAVLQLSDVHGHGHDHGLHGHAHNHG